MESTPHALICRYMDQLIDELRKRVPQVNKGWDSDDIHAARVITRRLKASIDLLDPLLSDKYRKPFAKVLRSMRRRLGPLRDLDVMIGHLQECTTSRKHALAIAWLIEQLSDQRLKQRRKTARKSSTTPMLARLGNWWGLRHQIEESDQAINELLAYSLHTQLNAFTEQATRLKGVPHHTLEAEQSEDPHGLRIAGKLLRYTLELADVAGHPMPKSVLKKFKRMQDSLGLWHDYIVLSETAIRFAAEGEIAAHRRILYEQLLDLSRMFWRRAEHQLARFSDRWDEEGEQLTATIRNAFPLPPTAEQTPAEQPIRETSEQSAPLPPSPTEAESKAVDPLEPIIPQEDESSGS